jgi:hypothetical protein
LNELVSDTPAGQPKLRTKNHRRSRCAGGFFCNATSHAASAGGFLDSDGLTGVAGRKIGETPPSQGLRRWFFPEHHLRRGCDGGFSLKITSAGAAAVAFSATSPVSRLLK